MRCTRRALSIINDSLFLSTAEWNSQHIRLERNIAFSSKLSLWSFTWRSKEWMMMSSQYILFLHAREEIFQVYCDDIPFKYRIHIVALASRY